MYFDIEAIQKQHEVLLLQSGGMGNDDISPITSFLESLARAGAEVQDSRYRAQLRALIRYWANVVSEKTGSLPLIQLQPFDETKYALKHQLFRSADHQIDWGEAPNVGNFYGREQELATLQQWIVGDRCRLIAVLGVGGIGKTALTAQVTDRIKDQFEYVFWRSLHNAPPLENILKNCIHFFSREQQIDLPEDIDSQLNLLIQYLHDYRCLLIMDNVETIMQSGNLAGYYRDGYEGYGRLLQLVGEAHHQSCLLLTSRDKPKEVALLEGEVLSVRSSRLEGLNSNDGLEILKDKGLRGTKKALAALTARYGGNPLALKLASQFIREVFDGNIVRFLKEGEVIFIDINNVLDQQFERLSIAEQGVMYWLAIEREAASLSDLQKTCVHPLSQRELEASLSSLQRRSLIETRPAGFILQSVIMEYITERLVDSLSREIRTGDLSLFRTHALMKAQSKDYIRESQIRLILRPLTQQLIAILGREEFENTLKGMLTMLHKTNPQKPDYAAGNILNLLVQQNIDIRGLDFSDLTIWQAYLQGAILSDTNFMNADLAKSVFTEGVS